MSIIYCPNKSSAERENVAVYARSPEKALIGILNDPVKWIDNRVEVDKILFISVVLQYKLLHIVFDSGGSGNIRLILSQFQTEFR